jgi:hypothetical protein
MATFMEEVYQYFAGAAEAAPGTAITPPTYVDLAMGSAKPAVEYQTPKEQAGVLAGQTRKKLAYKFAEWEQEGNVDLLRMTRYFTYLLSGGVTTPTTPASGVLTRLWTFARQMTGGAATQLTETLYGGDPNIQIWQFPFGVTNEMTFTADASNNDGVQFTRAGFARFPTKVSAPALPALSNGNLLNSQNMQLWIDTSSTWGTTAVTGRLVTAEVTIPNGQETKRFADGPASALTFNDRSPGERVSPTLTIGLEVPDMVQYDLFAAGTVLKVRIRFGGDAIETVAGPITYYEHLTFDMYGYLEKLEPGKNGASNITHVYTLTGLYNSTLGSDVVGYVQSTQTALV